MYEVNYNTLAVVISDPAVEDLTEVRNLFISCNNRLREMVLVDGYVGIAEPEVDLLKLSQCYARARDACEYVRYYRMATPMSKDELPELSADQFMSAELERRLCNTIREGSEEDLCRVFQEIETIMDERKPGLPMVRHYMNYIRSAAIRVLSEYCVEESILTRVGQIGEAETWSDLFRLIVEAKRMIKRITENRSGKDPEPIREELMAMIHEKYCRQDFTLAAVAETYGVSESKMYKDFRLYFGKSFAEILEEVRMEQACKLLGQGVPVKEVTVRTGYGSDTSFRRAFKRTMGVSPTDYCQCAKQSNTTA